jgi:hypothetical protein
MEPEPTLEAPAPSGHLQLFLILGLVGLGAIAVAVLVSRRPPPGEPAAARPPMVEPTPGDWEASFQHLADAVNFRLGGIEENIAVLQSAIAARPPEPAPVNGDQS